MVVKQTDDLSSEIAPPSAALKFNELSAGFEYAECLLRMPWLLATSPRGAGQPVVVLPGFMADDSSTVFMRGFLSVLGYDVKGWGLGRSTGSMMQYLGPVARQVEQLVEETGEPVRLVGWSRGGMIAREIAREHPDSVAQVITMGSPVRGGVEATSISTLVARQVGTQGPSAWRRLRARTTTPIQAPLTALYSKSDGIVAWQACIDAEPGPNAEYVEVRSTHIGMGFNANVLEWVARRLV